MEKNRDRAKAALTNKLFILDDNLGHVLMYHRSVCQDMVKDNYFIDMGSKGTEVRTLNEFS